MVIGEFTVNQIHFDDLEVLWCRTREHAGISKRVFYEYFSDKDKGYAIEISDVIEYEVPQPLYDLYSIRPPQSFAYLHP
jgi:predicted transcriptional regulator